MIPRIVIAGTQSGVGKTSVTLGLVTLLRRRGLRVQTFKVGPDYLDPTHLAVASGRTCYNLDGWMMGRAHVLAQFARATRDADIAVIEGVMGLFDGASPNSLAGSTAEIAAWLQAPVVLVVDARGMARSVAAMVRGYAEFDAHVRVAGVIANRCGSERHVRWLAKSLRAAGQPRLLGTAGTLPELSSRHLGLVTAGKQTRKLCAQLADALAPGVPLEAVLRVARSAPPLAMKTAKEKVAAARFRVGLADDEAFHFYYADNLEVLERAGVKWVRFSPLRDGALPDSLDGLYFGGGYPEEHAAALSANDAIRRAVRQFTGLVYAECGGLMYLSRGIVARDRKRHRMCGVLPGWTRMCEHRQALGYAAVTLTRDSFFGKRGETLRGHEFHYSDLAGTVDWPTAYAVRRRQAAAVTREGFQHGNVLASYVHLHWASRPQAVRRFVKLLEERCGR